MTHIALNKSANFRIYLINNIHIYFPFLILIFSERQNQNVIKTIIFPEGSTTNGKYILPFKRGVFMNLKAVKPLITFPFDGCICSTNRVLFFWRLLATFRTKCVYSELPIIKPTNFMFKNFSTLFIWTIKKLTT